jgi:hypothetical protein
MWLKVLIVILLAWLLIALLLYYKRYNPRCCGITELQKTGSLRDRCFTWRGRNGRSVSCPYTRLGRTVAIKILPTELSSDPARRQRFQREAKIISGLNHPHICVVHDIGSQDGLDFLVMEFLVKNPAYSWQKTSGCPRFESIRCPPDFCSIPRVDWPSGEAEAQVGTVLRASIYAVLVLVIYHAVRGRRARA